MKTPWLTIAFAAALCICSPLALAQPLPPEAKALQIAPGVPATAITGTIKGYDVADYVVSARAGQTLSVALKARLNSVSFNIMPRGEETGIYNSSINGNTYTGVLPQDGDYIIRVYMMRNDARRGKSAAYTLTASIKP